MTVTFIDPLHVFAPILDRNDQMPGRCRRWFGRRRKIRDEHAGSSSALGA